MPAPTDPSAALVERWLPQVLRWCARLAPPGVDPEDAAHDVMIILLRKVDTVDDPEDLGGWVFGVTRNVLRNARRKAWLRKWVPGLEIDPSDPSPTALARVAADRRARAVADVLGRLPEPQREVLVLCDLEERSSSEASELLGIAQGTVKSRLRLARQRFVREARLAGLAATLAPAEVAS